MQQLIQFIENLNLWHWLGTGLSLVIFEMLLGTNFFLLWIGISAVTVGIIMLVFPSLSWEIQFIIFALQSLACLVFWNLHLKKTPNISDEPRLNRRSEQYIGRSVTLNQPIVNGRGKIHIDDSFWRIEGEDLPAGTVVKIISVSGVVLQVEKTN